MTSEFSDCWICGDQADSAEHKFKVMKSNR